MSVRMLMVSASAVLVLVAGGCSADPDLSTPSASGSPSMAGPSSSPSATAETPVAVGTTITTDDSEFGPMLFDAESQAIYIWEVETSSKPRCYDDCAAAWPPVLTDGAPAATGDVDPDLLGTTARSDGATQVTYNGHPLYYYAHEGPGEVKCHNVATHGGVWWVVQPDGNRAP